MGWYRTGLVVGIAGFALAAALLPRGDVSRAAWSARESAPVLAVIDGDTIEVLVDGRRERVRYIGIDAPEVRPVERAECHGQEATSRNEQLVGGQTVELEKDVSERDQYGRLLRYVWVGETFVNAELLFEGFAQVVTYPPDVRHHELYGELQRQARRSGRGLWSACLGWDEERRPGIVPSKEESGR